MSLVQKKGLLLGVYEPDSGSEEPTPTLSFQRYNSKTNGKLLKDLKSSGSLKKGKSRLFYGLDDEYNFVSVVGLGPQNAGYNELEEIEEKKENVRVAVGVGARQLQESGAGHIAVDDCGDTEAAAEGASLSLFSYDELKQPSLRKTNPTLELFNSEAGTNVWEKGLLKGKGQNIARKLMETPANLMTPTIFAKSVAEIMESVNVKVVARDLNWIESKKMGSYLSVTRGSAEPPVFLEMTYYGREESAKPLVLVGKGITFDSGGISLKQASNMDAMRADMGGAACTVGAIYTLAALKAPINVIGLTPLCENMPSGTATKPGDVVIASNGKSIQVDNTDAEGRLVLADALIYAHTFNPSAIVDLATLTGAVVVALGSAASGVFTNSSAMWMMLQQSGMGTGDRMWRLPLFKHYTSQVTDSQLADVLNIGKIAGAGGSCTAAAFLREFVNHEHWVHIDIAGVMANKDEVPYLRKGMAGRPTRTLVEFAQRLAQRGY